MSALKPSIPATDANINCTDVTTNNASTTKHGFCPKLDNTATNFLTGTGAWAVPAGNGAVTGFTASQNTSSPNNTVNASRLLVAASSLNADAVLQPKGSGSILAQLSDSSINGGNKRSGYSNVDLQMKRNSADQVAGGGYSCIPGGQNNKATGARSFAMGRGNISNGQSSASIGAYNTANSSYAIVFGGNNTASASHANVGGGYGNTANAEFSCIPGGKSGTTRLIEGMCAIASGKFATLGDAQRGQYILRGLTTTNAAKVLTTNQTAAGTTNQCILPNNSNYAIRGLVSAHRTDVIGTGQGWYFFGTIRRGANAASTTVPTAITAVSTGGDANAATWTLTVTADATNGGVAVTFTGENSKTICCVCVLETCEVTS